MQTPQGAPSAPPAPPAPTEAKFTQADLDKFAGEARSQARSITEKELLAKLGVSDVDAALSAIEAHRAHEDSQKTELQRVTDERDRAVAEAQKAQATALKTLAVARLESALRDAGVRAERIPAALRLADLDALKVEGTEVAGVPEAVEAVKQASPEWFGSAVSPPDASTTATNGAPDYRVDKEAASRVLAERYGIRA